MNRAVIYARYSSDKQNDRSIEDQVALCRVTALREGFTVAHLYEDRALSGASLFGRGGLQDLLADAKAGLFDVVVVEALDRLSRDQEDLAGVFKRLAFMGVRIHTVQDGAAGDMHVGIKGLLGSLYLKDLAQKTHRGLSGVIDAGRHAGGRAYGYRVVPGQRGELAIDEAEAAVVRRICADYLAGRSPRAIAIALNAEGVPGPRSGWGPSTIIGSRERENGILRNHLYAGMIVWNRQRFIKDPETGKRVSRPNPKAEWRTAEAPHLRIVPPELWEAVQAKVTAAGAERPGYSRAPAHLLSGLLKCGTCGAGYNSSGPQGRIACSGNRDHGLSACTNGRTMRRVEIEERVIAAVRDNLLDPDFAAEYVRAYHEEMRVQQRGERQARANAEAAFRAADSAIQRTVAAISDGLLAGDEARARMQELRAKKADAEAALADAPDHEKVIELHPGLVTRYRERIATLHQALAGGEPVERETAVAAFRALVERVEISSAGPRAPVDITVLGTISALVRVSGEGRSDSPRYRGMLVAGTRNQRTQHFPPIRLRA